MTKPRWDYFNLNQKKYEDDSDSHDLDQGKGRIAEVTDGFEHEAALEI